MNNSARIIKTAVQIKPMDILESFKQLYSQFDCDTANNLDDIYTADIVFTDPIHRIEGLEQVKRYFKGNE